MGCDDMARSLRLLCAPKWKFWITSARRQSVRAKIVEAGPAVVRDLLAVSVSDQAVSGLIDEVNSILAAIGPEAIPVLAEVGKQARNLDEVTGILYHLIFFDQLPPEVIPCLILWIGCLQRPETPAGVLPKTNNTTMDDIVLPEIRKLPLDTVQWFVMAPDNKKDTIQMMASDAFAKVGQAARPFIPVLEYLLARRRMSLPGSSLEGALKILKAL